MAKALNKHDTPWRTALGHAIERTFALAGLSDKEAAGLLDKDTAQVARWIAGTERPQMDALLAVERLRAPLVLALAELADVDVETTIRIRRRA